MNTPSRMHILFPWSVNCWTNLKELTDLQKASSSFIRRERCLLLFVGSWTCSSVTASPNRLSPRISRKISMGALEGSSDTNLREMSPPISTNSFTNQLTKLDVRWGYNNIQIWEVDQWKAAFKTNKGLYKPTVMFFGMCYVARARDARKRYCEIASGLSKVSDS